MMRILRTKFGFINKLLIILTSIIVISACKENSLIELNNLANLDVFYLTSGSNDKIILGKSGSDVVSVDYYLDGVFDSSIAVNKRVFSFSLFFSSLGEFSVRLVAKDIDQKEISEINLKYYVKDKLIEPTPIPRPTPVPEPNAAWSNFNFPAPENGQMSNNKRLWATYYFLPQIDEQRSNGYALRDIRGASLGVLVKRKDWCDAAMEGSVIVKLINGTIKTFNYAGTSSKYRVSCKKYYSHNTSRTKFKIANGIYGDGVKGYNLVPFRTIAVDRRVIPYGTLVFIPDAVGTIIQLPNGQEKRHDGYFFSADTGGAIKSKHIDVYIGTSLKNPFNFVKSSSSKTFDAYIIKNDDIRSKIMDAHKTLR